MKYLSIILFTLFYVCLYNQSFAQTPVNTAACDTIYGITKDGRLDWIKTSTNESGVIANNLKGINSLAVNNDLGIVYYGNGKSVYWYDLKKNQEGQLGTFDNLTGEIESGGASYFAGYLYIGTEIDKQAEDIYRLKLTADGKSYVDEPENITQGKLPKYDYGDIIVTEKQGNTIIYGSTYEDATLRNHLWKYNVDTETYSLLNTLVGTYVYQLAIDDSGTFWAYDYNNGEFHNFTFEPYQIISTGFLPKEVYFDLGRSYCLPSCQVKEETITVETQDEDGSLGNGAIVVTFADNVSKSITLTLNGDIVFKKGGVIEGVEIRGLQEGNYEMLIVEEEYTSCQLTLDIKINNKQHRPIEVISLCKRFHPELDLYQWRIHNTNSYPSVISYSNPNGSQSNQLSIGENDTLLLTTLGQSLSELIDGSLNDVVFDGIIGECFNPANGRVACKDITWKDETFQQRWSIENESNELLYYKVRSADNSVNINENWRSIAARTIEELFFPYSAEAVTFTYENGNSDTFQCQTDNCNASATTLPPSKNLLLAEGDIVVFPNPVQTEMTLWLPCSKEPIHLEIFNSIGVKVFETTVEGSQIYTVELQQYSTGVYFIKTEVNHKLIYQKFQIVG